MKGVIAMKNLIFWWGVFFALVCVIVMFGMTAFGQNPPQPAPVEMQPLINMEEFFEPLKEWFFDILSQYWVILLTFFVVWFSLMCALSYLDGMVQRRLAIQRHQMQFREKQAVAEFEKQSKLEDYRRQLRESRYVERHEAEYRSRELNNIVLRDGENFANVDGTYYVRSEFHGVVNYKTLDQWRSEVEAENSQPLDFDNNDYGKIYDSIVDSDYRGTVSDADSYGGSLPNSERYQEGDLGLEDEPLPYEDKDDDKDERDWIHQRVFSEFFKPDVSSRHEKFSSGLDDFEREYRERQSQFRGGY